MEIRNGAEYAQNYDIVTKWVGDALLGHTLSVIGVGSGRIEESFGLEPVDIKVQAGRMDLILRDENDVFYHIEEQRNLTRRDLYRFAAYHFLAARKLGARLTDIVLASGDVYKGEKRLQTPSGAYAPLVVDFSARDGEKRLEQIRQEVAAATFDQWLELIFLPLYGKLKGRRRADLVEKVIRFESQLLQQNQISKRLLAATLIMVNKLIDKARLEQLWEVIKMLDIIEIAMEKGRQEGLDKGKNIGIQEGKSLGIQEGKSLGIQEGKSLGIQEGKSLGIQEGKSLGIQEGKSLGIQEATRTLLVDALIEKFGILPSRVPEQIHRILNADVLKSLFRQVFKCDDLNQFEMALNLACPSDQIPHVHA